ncbi:MAG: hypothetical protein CVU56_09145 [Deltaproteobacteria bacterium HGW-Deltaproteobacteria-14]|jgi:tetratricopeptide (TPR) repeat protein|nr:MAG: hypothetical protein CVU56_09145 [Deltaproteobacteria bacterium HGW-Deltaproteobacteria-14]
MRRLIVCCVATALALSQLAAAPSPAPPEQVRAVEIYGDGEVQFRAERWDAAAELFQRAYATWPDPAYLFNIGLSYEKAERWPLAIRYFERFLREAPETPSRPEVERRLVAARQAREAQRASVEVVTVAAGAIARVTSEDGIAPCTTPCTLRVDPGPVTVIVTLAGVERVATRSLDPAERWLVHERFDDSDVARAGPSRLGPAVSWAVAGAGLVTGIVFGVIAQQDYDDGLALARRSPLPEADYDALAQRRQDLRDHSLIADIGFGVAVTGAVVGAVLWFTGDAGTPSVDARTGVGSVSWRF